MSLNTESEYIAIFINTMVGRRGALSPICSTQDVLGKEMHVT
jgi:hypothetical protein